MKYQTSESWREAVEQEGLTVKQLQGHNHYVAVDRDGKVLGRWSHTAGELHEAPKARVVSRQTAEPVTPMGHKDDDIPEPVSEPVQEPTEPPAVPFNPVLDSALILPEKNDG